MSSTLADLRRHFAEEVCLAGGVLDDDVVAAFAAVPREDFLGPGPWQIPRQPRYVGDAWSYRTTVDDDPRRLYHNVLVAIDAERSLHSGLPSFLAFKIDASRIGARDRVVHVGCGLGYFTAIMAELASRAEVLAIEADPELVERARTNLRPWANVEVVTGDGSQLDPGPADVVFVNAGATHPAPIWIERLRPRGRLVLPLTHRKGDRNSGVVLLIEREDRLRARPICGISVYDCVGGREDRWNAALGEALEGGDAKDIRSIAAADHEPAETCWAHLGEFCVSRGAGSLIK